MQPPVEQITVDGKTYDITNKKPVPLSAGKHRVKIAKRGYRTIEKEISVDKDHVLFNFTLREVDLLPVTINSTPSGAQIFIDGMQRGLTSKALNLFPGTYNLRLILSGYVPFERTIEVKENQANRFDFTLQKDAGTLVLDVTPANAKILINKEDYSGKARIELAPGLYRIEIRADGYYPQSENITIARGRTLRKNYVLKQKTGKLNFAVSPAEAKVTLKRNGQVVKTWQGANYLKNLPVGDYTIEISAAGYAVQTKSLKIKEHKKTNLDVSLKKGITSGWSIIDTLEIKWVWVEGGTFNMGCTGEQSDCYGDEKPVHTVYVDGFYMSNYEVTVAQFAQFIKETGYTTDAEKHGYSWIWDGDWATRNGVNWKCDVKGDIRPKSEYNHPVIHVSWYDAVAFCKWLSKKTGITIRMPTEAEWEYAARGGQKSRGYKYAGSNNPDEVAWYDGNSGEKTHPVGQKRPNELGLYDMSGNVWEWCWDWYDSNYYSKSPRNNPKGPSGGSLRVDRGGDWSLFAWDVRVADRDSSDPSYSGHNLGFRLLRTR